jgi:adenine-specific DNA-methyltransferase
MCPTNMTSENSCDGQYQIENRRYIGSKVRLIPQIFEAVPEGLRGGHFLDVFAGTGVVAAKATEFFSRVSVNDHLFSNEVVYRAFLGRSRYSRSSLQEFVDEIRHLKLPKSNYFSREFGNRYFTSHDAIKIGAIRERLESRRHNLSQREFCILLASLLYSVDRSARTVGHYEAFLRMNSPRNDFEFRLIRPLPPTKVSVFRQDANELVRKLSADVTYIDPPYNSRQYSRFYHVLETLVKWDKPRLAGVARKPPTENSSAYCKTSAPQAFADLIASLDSKLIVVSYNNTYESKSSSSKNKISHEFIREVLGARGKLQIKSFHVAHFNAGRGSLLNHKEHIFVCRT